MAVGGAWAAMASPPLSLDLLGRSKVGEERRGSIEFWCFGWWRDISSDRPIARSRCALRELRNGRFNAVYIVRL